METFDARAAYAAHGAELYRLALRQLGDDGAAQDVVQEVFLRAWRAADSYDPLLASLRTWLFAIARNVVVDEARRFAVRPWQRQLTDDVGRRGRRSRPSSTTGWWTPGWSRRHWAGSGPTTGRRSCRPTCAAARTPRWPRELGIPVGTLRSRVFYGLKALRLAMEEMGVEP